MARNVLANAFSLTMLPIEAMDFVRVKKINPNDVPADVGEYKFKCVKSKEILIMHTFLCARKKET